MWAGIIVWLFAFFVAANFAYYVYVHEPAVKRIQIDRAELAQQNRDLNKHVIDLQQEVEYLSGVIADYSIMFGISYDGSGSEYPHGYEPKAH